MKRCQGYHKIKINQNIHNITTKVGWDSPQDMKKAKILAPLEFLSQKKLAPKRHKNAFNDRGTPKSNVKCLE